MESTQRKITTAQLFSIIFILGISLKMLMLPVLLLKCCGRDSVLGLSGILLSELLCLGAAVAAIMLSPQKSFTELLQECIGKWASKVVFMLLALFYAVKLILSGSEVNVFFCENMFTYFPWAVYAVPFFGLCIFVGMGACRTVGRLAQFMFPVIVAATVGIFVMIGVGVDFVEIFPFGEFKASGVADTALRHAMWYGDYSVLAVFLGSVKRTRKTAWLSMVSGIAASVAVLFFAFGLIASYSNICSMIRFGQNVTGMAQYALGNVMQGRFDLLCFCVWMMSLIIKSGIFMYAIVFYLQAVFPVGKALPSLIVGVVLYIVSAVFPSPMDVYSVMTEWLAYVALAVQFIVPTLMLVATLVGRRRERKMPPDAQIAAIEAQKTDARVSVLVQESMSQTGRKGGKKSKKGARV